MGVTRLAAVLLLFVMIACEGTAPQQPDAGEARVYRGSCFGYDDGPEVRLRVGEDLDGASVRAWMCSIDGPECVELGPHEIRVVSGELRVRCDEPIELGSHEIVSGQWARFEISGTSA